jgi:hypothetical protein
VRGTQSFKPIRAPFPWFGGKSRAAHLVWERFGDVPNYVEPFFGSGAVLLGRPTAPRIETVNDLDGYICNFFRAIQSAPEAVAEHADWPVNENDLNARHAWLTAQRTDFVARLEGDPHYCDAKIAGWWVWGISCWIGSGWCSGNGPWHVVEGKLLKAGDGIGVRRQRPHLRPQGVWRQLPHLANLGRGVNRQRPELRCTGVGVHSQKGEHLMDWFCALQSRFRRVRVCCGDWSRVVTPAPLGVASPCGVFLDPPYSNEAGRDMNLYTEDSGSVARDCREWALAHGDDPNLRIALCGYEGEHKMPDSWECIAWKAHGGYAHLGDGAGKENRHRERIWLSPHCIKPQMAGNLFTCKDTKNTKEGNE